MRHNQSRVHVCGGLLSRPQCNFRLATALAVKYNRKGEGGSDEVVFDVDKGWSPNAQDLAQHIQTAIEDSQGAEYTLSTREQEDGEIVFSTSWEDEELGDDVLDGLQESLDGDDEEDMPVGGWLDTGWSVSVAEPDVQKKKAGAGDDEEVLAPDSDTIQSSSRRLLRELAAPAGPSQASGAEEAEDMLASLRPHEVKRVRAEQAEASENEKMMTPAEQKRRRRAKQRHTQLKIIAGTAAGRRLYSPAGEEVRPMMEKVRGALFSMLLTGTVGRKAFAADARWLDLFSGTGAVGLEGLSRGCGEGHFVEMDSWVIGKCLNPNIEASGLKDQVTVHQSSVEGFLRRSLEVPSFAGGPFDYISVTPPYMMVSYSELYELLDQSGLVHERSVVIVEYAAQNKPEVRQNVGPLQLVKSRRYGRTFLALYANAGM